MKKIIAVIFSVLLLCTVLSGTIVASAAGEGTMLINNTVYQMDTPINTETVKWNKETKTLELNNYNGDIIDITTGSEDTSITLVIKGNNKINATATVVAGYTKHDNVPLYCDGLLNISGTGTLSISTDTESRCAISSCKINVKSITLNLTDLPCGIYAKQASFSNCTINATDVLDVIVDAYDNSIEIDNVSITAKNTDGATGTIFQGVFDSNKDITANKLTLSLDYVCDVFMANDEINVTNSKITGNITGYLFSSDEDVVNISDCVINVSTLDANDNWESIGIYAPKIKITNSDLTLKTQDEVIAGCLKISVKNSKIKFQSLDKVVFNMNETFDISCVYSNPAYWKMLVDKEPVTFVTSANEDTSDFSLRFNHFEIQYTHICKDFAYTDNGNGTHEKTCSECKKVTKENHVFKDGVCICGAKDPSLTTTTKTLTTTTTTIAPTTSTTTTTTTTPTTTTTRQASVDVNSDIPQTGSSVGIGIFVAITTIAAGAIVVVTRKKKLSN